MSSSQRAAPRDEGDNAPLELAYERPLDGRLERGRLLPDFSFIDNSEEVILKGRIVDGTRDGGLDKQDRWSGGGVSFPPP
ncbi:hypothetical protein ACTZWT_14380 [Rhodopseudomonas sp. NSM]|uniref:hypothetical protein n=1 Tax=Rhodopseudomonas sp. NSM TaxID=3457630 RepID=UPI0040371936